MTKQEMADLAATMNMRPLDYVETTVETKLTDSDRMRLSEEQSASLTKVAELEYEKKKFNRVKKNEIDGEMNKVFERAQIIKDGCFRENKKLPCFLDFTLNQRVYVDPEKGNVVVKREELKESDRQLRIL